jgi:copper transport protein
MLLRMAIALFSLVGGASASVARPLLDEASPRPASTVRRAPSHIALSFTEHLLPSRSDAVLRSATGAVVSSGKARVIDNKEIQVPVNSLSPGKYKVEWFATSAEKQSNQGSFTFVVGDSTAKRPATTGQGSCTRPCSNSRSAQTLAPHGKTVSPLQRYGCAGLYRTLLPFVRSLPDSSSCRS